MAPATLYGPEDFMPEFECIPDKEFEFNGRVASWAPDETGPRFWDAEDECIDVPAENPHADIVPHSALALTPDERFLAVAINTNVRIYDVESLRMCAELAPHPHLVYSLDFRPRMSDVGEGVDTEYLLVSTTIPHADEKEKMYLSKLKVMGGLIEAEAPSTRFLTEGNLRAHGSALWSPDGSRMLYLMHTRERGPEVVVFDTIHLQDICRLQDHKDFITSASWSPDGTLIATASWDGSYGIWVALSGVRRHSIPTFGSNYHCSFLTDGVRLLVSGGPTDKKKNNVNRIAIYSVVTAELVVSLELPEGLYLKPLPRLFAAHPSRDLIIVHTNRCLLAWTPFEMATDEMTNEESAVQFLLTLGAAESSKANRFAEFTVIKWIDGGCKLLVQGEDQTIFIWEPKRRLKWRFQRPKGRAVDDAMGTDALYVRRKGAEWVLSMGEGRVRFWKL